MAPASVLPELPAAAGWFPLLRGHTWIGMRPGTTLYNWRSMPRRISAFGFLLMIYILDRLNEAGASSVEISLDEFRSLTAKSRRAIRQTLDELEHVAYISRDNSANRWQFTAHPENFATAPLLEPRTALTKAQGRKGCRPREAAVTSSLAVAALRADAEIKFHDEVSDDTDGRCPHGNWIGQCLPCAQAAAEFNFPSSTSAQLEPEPDAEINFPQAPLVQIEGAAERIQGESEINFREKRMEGEFDDKSVSPRIQGESEIDFRAPSEIARETDFPAGETSFTPAETSYTPTAPNFLPPETYCPWGWHCPLIPSDLQAPKNSKNSKKEELSRTQPPDERTFSGVEESVRPSEGSGLFNKNIREWLTANVAIPTPLEQPVVDQIGATISSQLDLEQFQDAALRVPKPRGWRVFITIANACVEHREAWRKAREAKAKPVESDIRRQIREAGEEVQRHEEEARKKWRNRH